MPFFSQTKAPKMARTSSSASPARVAVQTVYFAYGSNLQLAQMARRCPESRYLGRGRLPDFKWQINTRGYANIRHSTGDTVEGLCFLLSQKDEKRLDINEGVPTAYEKEMLPVEIFAATASIVGRRVREVIEVISRSSAMNVIPKYHSDTPETVNALVYVNWVQISEGAPKTEYVSRISYGISDAKLLGIPAAYFEKYVRGPMERLAPEDTDFPGRSESGEQPGRRRQMHTNVPERRPARLQSVSDGRDYNETGETHQNANSRVIYNIIDVGSAQEQVRSQSDNEKVNPDADALHRSPEGEIHEEEVPESAMEEDQERQGEDNTIPTERVEVGLAGGHSSE